MINYAKYNHTNNKNNNNNNDGAINKKLQLGQKGDKKAIVSQESNKDNENISATNRLSKNKSNMNDSQKQEAQDVG